MKILLIGGTGNLSTEVAEELNIRGGIVSILTTGHRTVPKKFKHFAADRNNEDTLKEIFNSNRFDVIIDFVAFVPEQLEKIYNVCKGSISQFIFISSATVYHKPHQVLPITEKVHRGNPFWKYAQDKIACEEFCEKVHGKDFPVTIVRPSHTFGKTWIPSAIHHSDYTVASRILNNKPIVVHGDGTSLWTLTAASDFASGLVGLVGNRYAIGESFHITTDEYHSWNEIYSILGEVLGVLPVIEYVPVNTLITLYPDLSGPLLGDKAENGVFDNSKIKRVISGFKCRKKLREQFQESVEWFNEDICRRRINISENERADRIISSWRNINR
jgi:nucleoside-diphosphate-sugar epimerase